METLGQDFKRRREERKLTLRDVAEATRVGVRFLTAIEADDFSALPGGIYTRSFVRAYAKFLGMDEEDVLARYRKQVATEEPPEPMMSYKEYPSESSSMSLYIGVLVLLGIIVGGAYGLIRYIDLKSSSTNNASTSTSPTPTATPGETTSQSPNPTAATPKPSPIFEQVVLTLKTKEKQEAWVSVNTDDVEKPLVLTIPANSSRDFKADSKLKITVGNISGVQAQINGQNAKLPNDGVIAKNILITKENYQEYLVAASSPEATPTPKPKTTGTKAVTGTTTETPNPESTPNATPKPKVAPKPVDPTDTTQTTIDPTANPDSTPKPKIKKPKPVDPDNPSDGVINIPDAINTPKPKLIKPTTGTGVNTGDASNPTTTPKASPKPKTTPSGTTTNPNSGTGTAPPKPKATPKPENTTAKPN